MALDLAPAVEKTIQRRAAAEGATPSDFLARLLNVSAPATAPNINATEALFRQWDEEDAHMTEEERQEEDAFWDKFTQGVDESRRAAGMRLLFSDEAK